MVDVAADIRAVKGNVGVGRLSAVDERLRQSLLGQLYVADWKYLLAAAGRTWKISVPEHATGGGAITQATGNAAVDLDQPELVVAVDAGHRLIPIEFDISLQADLDAYDDQAEVYLFADRTQAQATATATAHIPTNLLDGAAAFPGRAWSIVTADITDPVHSEILAYRIWELTQVAAEVAGNGIPVMEYKKDWSLPTLIDGPCQIVGAIAATVAPTFMAQLTVGVVPSSWFPTDQ